MAEKEKERKHAKQFPLPPVGKRGKKRRSSRVKKLGEPVSKNSPGVTQAPDKLLQRVNQELYKRNAELAARNKTLALLRQLDEISLTAVQIDELAKGVTEAIATALGYDVVSIAVVDE